MEPNRIVVEFFLERPSFKEVSKVAKSLEQSGIKPIIMPAEDRGINTHLAVEKSDLQKVKDIFKKLGLEVAEKEILLLTLENRPGTMAETTAKISAKGINMTYAFSVAMTPKYSYVLLGTEDNEAALKALK